jgi:hypothetical protein
MMATVANGVALYLNDGGGVFSFDRREGLWWDPWSILHADLTGDGIADLAAVTARQAGTAGLDRALTILPGTGAVTVGAPVAGGTAPGSPAALSSIRPNPIGANAHFTLEVGATQRVSVALYDVRGRVAAVLHEGPLSSGTTHRFSLEGSELPAGVYFVRAAGETFSATRKAVLVR